MTTRATFIAPPQAADDLRARLEQGRLDKRVGNRRLKLVGGKLVVDEGS